MKEESREKYLKELAKTNYGVALIEWLDIEIKRLENIRLVPEENFEIEAKSRKNAAEVLRKLLRFLNSVKQKTTERDKNPYI